MSPRNGVLLIPLCFAIGCASNPAAMLIQRPLPTVGRDAPGRYVVRASPYAFTTDDPLDPDDPMIKELVALSDDIGETLDIRVDGPPIRIAIFSNRQAYHEFLARNFPALPERRAFFIQEGTHERAVFACKGDRLREDLRHEVTHAVLHSRATDIPIWLDEGLAEYFETADQPAALNRTHLAKIREDRARGWRPDLARLEQRMDLWQMSPADYRESWLWAHFLLHRDKATKAELTGGLLTGKPIHETLTAIVGDPESALLAYLDQLVANTEKPETVVPVRSN